MTQWHILGAGSVGCLMARLLAEHDISPRLILSSPARRADWQAEQLDYQYQQQRQKVAVQLLCAAELKTPLDHLLICTKTYTTERALTPLLPYITPQTTLLLLQNGMGMHEWMMQTFPDNLLILGTISHGAYRTRADHVVHSGWGQCYWGTWQPSTAPQTMTPLLSSAWEAQWCDDMQVRLWHKLAVNSAINPLTVLYNCKNGELLQNAEALALMQTLCTELTAIMHQLAIPLPTDGLWPLVRSIAERTAANISSMRQDVLNNKPTEIDAITGHILRKSQQLGMSCPAHEEVMTRFMGQSGSA